MFLTGVVFLSRRHRSWAIYAAAWQLTNPRLLSRRSSASLMMYLSPDGIAYLGALEARWLVISLFGCSSWMFVARPRQRFVSFPNRYQNSTSIPYEILLYFLGVNVYLYEARNILTITTRNVGKLGVYRFSYSMFVIALPSVFLCFVPFLFLCLSEEVKIFESSFLNGWCFFFELWVQILFALKLYISDVWAQFGFYSNYQKLTISYRIIFTHSLKKK